MRSMAKLKQNWSSNIVAKLGNMFQKGNLCPGSKNTFDPRQWNILVSKKQNLFLEYMFPTWL